jgi:hypothetical protein
MIPPVQFILIAGLLYIYIYIYKVFQRRLQWLKVIRMQPYPNICSLGPKSDALGVEGGVSVGI